MNKMLKQCVALLFCLLLLTSSVWAAGLPSAPSGGYVLDDAGVISAETEQKISDLSETLFGRCGAQIYVMTTEFTGNTDIEDYTHDLYNHWGIGKDGRGALLLLSIGAEDYYCALGDDLDTRLTAGTLYDILQEELEPDFAKEEYDAGTLRFVRALSDEVARLYGEGGAVLEEDEYKGSVWDLIGASPIPLMLVLLVLLGIIARSRTRRGYHGGNGWLAGFLTGSAMSSHRSSSRSYRSSHSRPSSSRSRSSSSRSRSYSRPAGGRSRGSGAGRSSGGGRRR